MWRRKPVGQPRTLLPTPPQQTISSNTFLAGAIWRSEMTHESFQMMQQMVNDLKNKDVGAIEIIFGIPPNVNKGVSHKTGNESVNPKSGRTTTAHPMVIRPMKWNDNMDFVNVKLQGEEFRKELSKRLGIPVSIQFVGNSTVIKINYFPKKR